MPWVKAMTLQAILAAASRSRINATQLYTSGTSLSEALRWATAVAAGGSIVVAGSLYLVPDVLRLLRDTEKLKTHGRTKGRIDKLMRDGTGNGGARVQPPTPGTQFMPCLLSGGLIFLYCLGTAPAHVARSNALGSLNAR
jgi:hypothetical protein